MIFVKLEGPTTKINFNNYTMNLSFPDGQVQCIIFDPLFIKAVKDQEIYFTGDSKMVAYANYIIMPGKNRRIFIIYQLYSVKG